LGVRDQHGLGVLKLGHDHGLPHRANGKHSLPEAFFSRRKLEFGERRCSKQPSRGCNLRKLRDFWSEKSPDKVDCDKRDGLQVNPRLILENYLSIVKVQHVAPLSKYTRNVN